MYWIDRLIEEAKFIHLDEQIKKEHAFLPIPKKKNSRRIVEPQPLASARRRGGVPLVNDVPLLFEGGVISTEGFELGHEWHRGECAMSGRGEGRREFGREPRHVDLALVPGGRRILGTNYHVDDVLLVLLGVEDDATTALRDAEVPEE